MSKIIITSGEHKGHRFVRCDSCLCEIVGEPAVTKFFNETRSDMCARCEEEGFYLSDDLRFFHRAAQPPHAPDRATAPSVARADESHGA